MKKDVKANYVLLVLWSCHHKIHYMEKKKIHFIGICGVAMSALAIAFDKKGWQVSGSDVGFYPPVSTNLKNTNINFYPGWHVEKMTENGNPNLVVVGNVASSTNPEWIYVQEKKLNYKSYPEVISEFFVAKNSIVCAGTYGKTTTSSLLSYILEQNDYNPSYMFGGLLVDDFNSAKIGDKDWSVLEGDEYKTARWDNSPKFDHYNPTHLLLTAVQWDHADIYKTEKSYFDAFKKLTSSIPENGLALVSENIPDNISNNLKCKIIKYGKQDGDYTYTNIKQNEDGLEFDILHDNNTHHISSNMIGEYMAENITACFAMANQIGIDPEKIIKSITDFKGIKRRLEKRIKTSITIFDDIAHSPAKASFVLNTLRNIYKNKKIFAIYEPNTGNRKKESVKGYTNAFRDADTVIIPRLTKVKIKKDEIDIPMDGKELSKVISASHNNVEYIEDDSELIKYVENKTQPGDVVVFLGSHGFRGMIEELIDCYTN